MVTFDEIEKNIKKKGGSTALMLERMEKQAIKSRAEQCDICNQVRNIDSRGLITIPDEHEDKIWKIHYNCVVKLIKDYKKHSKM